MKKENNIDKSEKNQSTIPKKRLPRKKKKLGKSGSVGR